MKKAFVIDFDGTITERDVGLSIIQDLTDDKWRKFEEVWMKQEIGTDEFSQIQWSSVKYDDKYIRLYAKKFNINLGFKEFISKIKEQAYKIMIASDGYDIYINEILDNEFKDLKVISNSATYDAGWKLSFPNRDEQCNLCGNCKKNLVEDLKNNGYEVYYIGDGNSDKCASLYADKIFAKSTLKKHCDEKNIPYSSFNNFYDVLEHI